MSRQRIDAETQRHMDLAFYGALQVINRHKKPGEALHPIPLQHVQRPVHVPAEVNEGLGLPADV